MYSKTETLKRVREILIQRKYADQTRVVYLDWIYRFLTFHEAKPPEKIDEEGILEFLTFLETKKKFAIATRKLALNAIAFLYKVVLHIELKFPEHRPANKEASLPLILTKAEIEQILDQMEGDPWLMTSLLYGSGLKVKECTSLRVRNLDFSTMHIKIFSDNGDEDHRTPLPFRLEEHLVRQVKKVKIKLEENLLRKRFCGVELPSRQKNILSETGKSLDWQFIFPSKRFRFCRQKKAFQQCAHSVSFLQKAVKKAVQRSKIDKRISCSTFRHSFAAHLLEKGYDLKTVQKMLGHKNVRSTMIYLKVINLKKPHLASPLDFRK
jgi:integron integrase